MKLIRVVAAVFKDENKILGFRRDLKKSLPGKWEFAGGKIELGETPEEALIREIKEELEIDARVIGYIDQTIHEYDFATIDIKFYYVESDEINSMRLNNHIETKWLNKDELYSVDWAEADIPVLEKIKYNL